MLTRAHIRTFAIAMMITMAALLAASSAPAAETYDFELNKRDKAALKAQVRADRMEAKAAAARKQVLQDSERLLRVQELLEDAQGDEARLRDALTERVIERYRKGGETHDINFLLQSKDISDVLDRSDVVKATQTQDVALARAHRVTVARLEALEIALSDLRDVHADQAQVYEEQVVSLEQRVDGARKAHVDESTQATDGKEASDGSWTVFSGELPDIFLNGLVNSGGPWKGNFTAPIPASPEQIAAILSDPRIDIYAGGRTDIAAGRIDGRVLSALNGLAGQFGTVHVTSLISGHGVYTSSGNVSAHTYGCAVDIGSVGGTLITPAAQGTGSVTEAAVKFLASLPGQLAPHQVISLNSYGGPTMAMADHGDHIHLGYSC